MNEYKMRRIDRELSDDDAKIILQNGSYGVLSTVGADGYPYGVPVNYAYDGEKIYFHCIKNLGHKQENIRFSDKVSFVVVTKDNVKPDKFTTGYESAVVFGTVQKNDDKKQYALELLIDKYSADFKKEGIQQIAKSGKATDIFEITIQKLSGKANRK